MEFRRVLFRSPLRVQLPRAGRQEAGLLRPVQSATAEGPLAALMRPLPDLAAQALDDLVAPLVHADEPVPLPGHPLVGLGLGARADQVGGPEHPDDRGVLLGEPALRDLPPVQEAVLLLHAPESPCPDGLAKRSE